MLSAHKPWTGSKVPRFRQRSQPKSGVLFTNCVQTKGPIFRWQCAADLPSASFAGQLERYLNIAGEDALVKTVHRCYASLFTNCAIKYRENQGFGNAEVAISMGVQKNGALLFVCLLGGLHPRPRHGFQQGGRLSTAFTASAKTLYRADSRPMVGWLSKYYFQNNERRLLPCLTLSVS